jgi:SET domain-containing protein
MTISFGIVEPCCERLTRPMPSAYAHRRTSTRICQPFCSVPRRIYRIGRSSTGLGLFATAEIKKGAYIVTYRGRLIPNEEAEKREARGASYMFEYNSKWTIDGSSRRNIARYVNHACKPNAEALTRKGRIVYVARRRIRPEEEITVDYGKDYFECFLEDKGCKCAACLEKAKAKRKAKRRKLRR